VGCRRGESESAPAVACPPQDRRPRPQVGPTGAAKIAPTEAGAIMKFDMVDWPGRDRVDQEILVDKGSHPQAESDFELFCEIMPEALGIES
jgi:hypothetical protein